MSNIAGKSYAMNVVTPVRRWLLWINRLIFRAAGTRLLASRLLGLKTLSLIHYARWVVIRDRDFPRLSPDQPRESLKYAYVFFFSNFNGSWEQYVASFSSAIPTGLDLMWFGNVRYPRSLPLQPFNAYILHNQIWTDHYYNAYPVAAANDVKAGVRIKRELRDFIDDTANASADDFGKKYRQLLLSLQHDLSLMAPTPVVSLAAQAVEQRAHERDAAQPGQAGSHHG